MTKAVGPPWWEDFSTGPSDAKISPVSSRLCIHL